MKNLFTLALLLASASAVSIRGVNDAVTYGDRVTAMPAELEGPGSDKLMHSIVDKYSKEKFVNGKPTGQFFVDGKSARALAKDLVSTHVKPANGKAGTKAYVKERFADAWARVDPNGTGQVEAARITGFAREVVGGSEY